MLLVYIYLTNILIVLLVIFRNLDIHQSYYLTQRKFVVFIAFTFFVEIFAFFFLGYYLKVYNTWLFNLFTALEFLIYAYFFKSVIHNSFFKKIVEFFFWVYPVAFLINVYTLQPLTTQFHTYTYSLGSAFIILLAIAYLFEQFYYEDGLEVRLVRQPFFWVSVGLLFFYSGSFIQDILINYLAADHLPLFSKLYDIIRILNILMYTLFAIGFSCHKIFRE